MFVLYWTQHRFLFVSNELLRAKRRKTGQKGNSSATSQSPTLFPASQMKLLHSWWHEPRPAGWIRAFIAFNAISDSIIGLDLSLTKSFLLQPILNFLEPADSVHSLCQTDRCGSAGGPLLWSYHSLHTDAIDNVIEHLGHFLHLTSAPFVPRFT